MKGIIEHTETLFTLFSYIVQFAMISDSMLPSRPKSAPEAPTEIPY